LDFAAGPTPGAIDQLIRDRVMPGEIVLGATALAMSLLLAFRRERRPAGGPPVDAPPVPDSLREVSLFRLRYALTFARGRLRPDERSARRMWVEHPPQRRISWRTPAADFPTSPDRPLGVIEAAGRAIASVDPQTGRFAVHEGDLARLHGLGRRGRSVLLAPLILSTLAFWLLARVRLADLLSHQLALPARDVSLAILLATAGFALTTAMVLAPVLMILSAVLRRTRRAQLRQRYEPALREFLAAAAKE
jgi:hypothetical protein